MYNNIILLQKNTVKYLAYVTHKMHMQNGKPPKLYASVIARLSEV